MSPSGSDDEERRHIWADFNKRQEFEHELINRKNSWLLATEGLLFTAYGLSSRDPQSTTDFRNAVAWAGLLIAAVTLFGVATLIHSKCMSWWEYRRFYKPKGLGEPPQPFPRKGRDGQDKPLAWGVRTWNTWLTLVPDVAIAGVFIGVWAYVLHKL